MKKLLSVNNTQAGAIPILLLIAAVGLLIFLFLTNAFSFKDRLFNTLFPKPPSKAQEAPSVPDEILFKFKEGVGEAVKENTLKAHGLTKLETIPQIEVLRVKVPAQARDQVIEALNKNPNIEYAEPNYIRGVEAVTNDPYLKSDPALFQNQWNMFKIQAADSANPSAWNITTGSSTVKIAILDTGIVENHEDLSGKIVARINYTVDPPATSANDIHGHGTHVAGIAGAKTNNSKGIAGVGYNSSLMNVKVCRDDGTCPDSFIANGIGWAADNGAKVINMSFAASASSATLENAVNNAWSRGVVLIAGAGNSGNSNMAYPAAYSKVIAVAATNSADGKRSSSNYGTWVDVAAPGSQIYTTDKSNTYNYWAGTSLATPHVAGEAALIWAKGACISNSCVRSQIETSADAISGTGTYWQWGRINAYKAVTQTPSTDTISPTTSITSPSGGSVSGTVTIQASASDNVRVTKVEFYVDGKLFATDLTSPYSFSWDTTKVSDGSHNLQTKSYDAAGNVGVSSIIVVKVANTATIYSTKKFGKTTIGANKGTYGSNQWGIKASLPENGSVSSITAYLQWDGNGSNNVKAVIYDDSSGKPNNKKGESGITTFTTTPSWITFNFSPSIYLSAGTYWLSVLGQEAGVYGYYDTVTSNINFFKDSAPWPTAMNPATVTSMSTHHNSVYATYSPSSSPAPTSSPTPTPIATTAPIQTPSPTPTPSGSLSWSVSATKACPYQNINVNWSYSGTTYKSFKPYLLDSLASSVAGPCSTSLSSSYTWTNKVIGGGHSYSVTLQAHTNTTCSALSTAPNKSVTQVSCASPTPTPTPTPTSGSACPETNGPTYYCAVDVNDLTSKRGSSFGCTNVEYWNGTPVCAGADYCWKC